MNSHKTNKNCTGPKRVHTKEPDEENQASKVSSCSTPSSPMNAAKDALELAVASLPTSLQLLITHFGQKIIMTHCKRYAKESIMQQMEQDKTMYHALPWQLILKSPCHMALRRMKRACPSLSSRYNKPRTLTKHP